MRIILLSIALLFCAFSAQSQVLKSAGVWYFLDVDSMAARPAVLPNGTELAYVIGTRKIYNWNRITSTWEEYGGGSAFNRDSIYFDTSIIGSGTVSDPWGVDSTLFATIAGVGDSIAAALGYVAANFFPLQGGTLTGTGGNGFVGFPLQSSPPSTPATGFSLFAGSTGNNISWMQPDGFFRRLVSPMTGTPRQYQFMARSYTLADSADVAALPTGSGTTNYYTKWTSSTALGIGNMTDNNTVVSILNSKPFSLGQWTTAGRPSGVNGYTGFNTSFNWLDIYSSTGWFSPARAATTGGAFTANYIPFGGTGGLTESSGFYRQNNYFWNVYDVDFSGFFFGETTSKYGGVYWRNVLEELHITSTPATAPIQIGLNAGIRLLGDDDFLLRDSSIYANRSATGGKFLINSTQISSRYEFLFKATKLNSFGVIGDFDYVGFDVGESATKTGGVFWRNTLERMELVTRGNAFPILFGNDWLYMATSGNVILGTTTDVTGYKLNITGTGAAAFPRGTVAQRPTIASSTTPFRYNTDSTALEYGESVGTWRQIATRAYARSLVAGATWLKPQLEAGSVTINAATNADLFINNLDSVKFGKTLIRSSNNGLLILNPDVGASGISASGSGYHTIINGTLNGSNGGTGNIALGGTATANSSGANFMMALGYASNTSGAYASAFGYNADATTDDALAIGRNALADENKEISLGSSIYSKLNLNATASGGHIIANGYGAGNKEAGDLSKTKSGYDAVYATDGTLLELERKRDTTILVNSATKIIDLSISEPSLKFKKVHVSAISRTDTTIIAFLGLPIPAADYEGVEYIIKNDSSGIVQVALLINGSYSNRASSYFLEKGQKAIVTSRYDYVWGLEAWDVHLVDDNINPLEKEVTDAVDTAEPVNGDFNSSTGWTLGTGWIISGGTATSDATEECLERDLTVSGHSQGDIYLVEMDVYQHSGATSVGIALNNEYYDDVESSLPIQNKRVTMLVKVDDVYVNHFCVYSAGGDSVRIDNIKIYRLTEQILRNLDLNDGSIYSNILIANGNSSIQALNSSIVIGGGLRVNGATGIGTKFNGYESTLNVNASEFPTFSHAKTKTGTAYSYKKESESNRFWEDGVFGSNHVGRQIRMDTTNNKKSIVDVFDFYSSGVDTSYFQYFGNKNVGDFGTRTAYLDVNPGERKKWLLGKYIGAPSTLFSYLEVDFDLTNGIKFYDKYALPNATPATGSGLKQQMTWTANVPAFEYVKKDTTIYIDDADYDWSAAISTATIALKFNRVIFWMTTTGAAGSDSDLTLHTPDANLMQVEYLIHSVDEAGGFSNKIVFGSNNAVDSTNGLVTNYFPAAGDGVHIRAGLRSGVYKYRYSK